MYLLQIGKLQQSKVNHLAQESDLNLDGLTQESVNEVLSFPSTLPPYPFSRYLLVALDLSGQAQ